MMPQQIEAFRTVMRSTLSQSEQLFLDALCDLALQAGAMREENVQLRKLIDRGRDSNATELGLSAQLDDCRKMNAAMRDDPTAPHPAEATAGAGEFVLVPKEPKEEWLRPFIMCPADEVCLAWESALKIMSKLSSRQAKLEEALKRILWIKDCGIDGRDETGTFRNWPETERDTMYKIAKDALK